VNTEQANSNVTT